MAQGSSSDIGQLYQLARDKTIAGRKSLVNAVSDLFFDSHELLTDREKALMTDILRQLLHDMEMSVRRELAERLAKTENAPHELVITLANDKIEVAYQILRESELLHDTDLIEIIHHRTLQHQLAIAMRKILNESVTDALVETGQEDVIKTMLENPDAKLSKITMVYLVDQSKRVDSYQNPLLTRSDLEPELVKRMYWWVSAAMRKNIIANFDIDPAEVRYLGTSQWENPEVSKEPVLAGGWFTAPPPELWANFQARYKDTYGAPPPRVATLGYDAVALAVDGREIGGQAMKARETAFVILGAANHDPAKWGDDAHKLDVTRNPIDHVGLGDGIHFCLGAPLARAEAQIAISTMLERFPKLKLAVDEPEWGGTFIIRGVKSLPLTF